MNVFYHLSAKRLEGKVKKIMRKNEMLIKYFSGGTQEQAFGHKSHRGSNYGNTWVFFAEKSIPYNKVSVDVKKGGQAQKQIGLFIANFGQELSSSLGVGVR